MPIEEIQECIDEGGADLSLQYCGEDAMTIAVEMAEAVKNGRLLNVTNVDLGGNAVDATAIEALGDMVLPRLTALKELDLRHNELGPDGAAALRSAVLKCNLRLKALYLNENKLHDGGAREALLLMLGLPALETIELGSNGLTPQVCPMIAKAVMSQSPRCLQVLSLEFNSFGDEGVAQLMQGITGARVALRELNLSDNCVGDDGVIRGIAPFLASGNQTLRSLDLSVNRIGAQGAKELARVLRAPQCSLEALDVGCNPISEAGGLALAGAAAQRGPLYRLDLTSTEMSMMVMQELMHAVEANPRVLVVHTGNNEDVPDAEHKKLYDMLQELPRDTEPWTPAARSPATRRWPMLGTVAAVVAGIAVVGGALFAYQRRAK